MSIQEYTRALGLLLIVLTAGTASGARADDVPALVTAALGQRPANPEQRCAYTRTRIQDDHSKSERYHPGAETPWTLEAVNGQPATDAERQHFAREAGEHDRKHPLDFDLTRMVKPGSWELLRQNDRQVVYRFALQGTDDIPDRVADKAVGTLVLDKSPPRPVRVEIANTGSAYVAPFVKIKDFSQTLSFSWDKSLDAPVLTEMQTQWRGRAFGLKKLSKHETLRYSDYACRDMKAPE